MVTAEEEFLNSWGIQESGRNVFYSLAPDIKQRVMVEFAPHLKPGEENNDQTGRFIVFARGVERGGKTVQQPVVNVEEQFLSAWGIQESGRNVFYDLTPDIQARVMAEFAPNLKPGEESKDQTGRFIMFARGVQRGHSNSAFVTPLHTTPAL